MLTGKTKLKRMSILIVIYTILMAAYGVIMTAAYINSDAASWYYEFRFRYYTAPAIAAAIRTFGLIFLYIGIKGSESGVQRTKALGMISWTVIGICSALFSVFITVIGFDDMLYWLLVLLSIIYLSVDTRYNGIAFQLIAGALLYLHLGLYIAVFIDDIDRILRAIQEWKEYFSLTVFEICGYLNALLFVPVYLCAVTAFSPSDRKIIKSTKSDRKIIKSTKNADNKSEIERYLDQIKGE